MRRIFFLTPLLLVLWLQGQEVPQGRSHALIVVGLPGDAAHEQRFADTAMAWREALTQRLGFQPADVRILFGAQGHPGLAEKGATRETIQATVTDLRTLLRPEDRVWVFFLGHGDRDAARAAFHLPGPDLHDRDLGKLFAGLSAREQVFWMTGSASGWFLKALSAKGRVVISATAADDEFNDTEFPQALATVLKRPRADLLRRGASEVTLLDLYRATVVETEARFAADKRLPTEHAHLDDDGDGKGSESLIVAEDAVPGKKLTPDGILAARIRIPVP